MKTSQFFLNQPQECFWNVLAEIQTCLAAYIIWLGSYGGGGCIENGALAFSIHV